MSRAGKCTLWYHIEQPGSNRREEFLPLEEAVGIRAAARVIGEHQGFYFYLKTG